MNSKIAMVSVVAASFFVGLLIFSFKSIIASTYFEGFPMWSTSVNLSQNEGEALKPWVGSDAARNVHVLWADNTLYPYASHDLFYKMRNPDGLWLSTEVIQKGDFNDFQSKLDHSGTVHVVWTGGTPSTLRYMYKPLAGTWSTPITVTTATRVRFPRLKVGPANTLHVMWQLQLNTESAWYIERSPQGTWLTPTLAIPSYREGYQYAIDATGVPHAVYSESGEIYYTSYSQGGEWTLPLNISDNPTPSEAPYVAIGSSGNIHIIWRDLVSPNNKGILYRSYIDNTWGDISTVPNTPDNPNPRMLSIAPDGTLHMVLDCYLFSRPTDEDWALPEKRAAPCKIQFAPNGDMHWIYGTSRNVTVHEWKTPLADKWSFILAPKVGSIASFHLDLDTPADLLHAVWLGQPVEGNNSDVFYSDFYEVNIDTITPITITNLQSVTIDVRGSGFLSTPTVYIGQTQLQNVTFTPPGQLRAEITPAIVAGRQPVKVMNPDGVYGVSNELFEIRNPIPIIESISPTEAVNLSQFTVTVTGRYFVPRLSVTLGTYVFDNVTWIDDQHIAIVVPPAFPPDIYALTVINPGPGEPASTMTNALNIGSLDRIFLPLISTQ